MYWIRAALLDTAKGIFDAWYEHERGSADIPIEEECMTAATFKRTAWEEDHLLSMLLF